MGDSHDTQTLAPGLDAAAAAALGRGSSLGRYVILSCLGSGGMGVVYAAYDAELDRKVALKLLRQDLAAAQHGQRRLLAEARALARLSHPHVVAVYDAGTFGERVFLVMEYVEGSSLAEWLAEPRPWRQILERFLEAGRGLAAVHRAGLVHRDVKPGNLLLGDDGRVRVADFGLAQPALQPAALTPPESDESMAPLAPDTAVGTPAFMAPEQRRGLDADARSDQYGFCVSLFFALYGFLPFAEGQTAGVESERIAAARAAKIPHRIHQTLLRGLRQMPAERYASMDVLVDALERAQPAPHRWLAAAALALGLMLAAIFLVLPSADGDQLCRGAPDRLAGVWDDARKQEIRQAFAASGLPYAETAWQAVASRLDLYTSTWAGAHRDACAATRLRGEQSEALLDRRMVCLDERLTELRTVTDLLAAPDEALLVRAAAVTGSLSSLLPCSDLASLTAATPPPEDAVARARVDEIRAEIARAKGLTDAARWHEALPKLEAAVAAVAEVGYRPLEALALMRLAELEARLGRFETMEEHLHQALAASLAGRAVRETAMIWTDFVILGWFRGRWQEAERWARLAQASIDSLGGDDELQADLLNRIGMLHNRQGLYAEAVGYFERSIELTAAVHGPDHYRTGIPMGNLGIALRHLERNGEALDLYQRALRLEEQAYGPEHPSVSAMLTNIGILHTALGDPRHALPYLERALAIEERVLAVGDPRRAVAMQAMGLARLELGEPELAIEWCEKALDLRLEQPADPAVVAANRFVLARALAAVANDRERALSLARQALDAYRQLQRQEAEEVEAWLASEQDAA